MRNNTAPFQVSATNPDWQQAGSVFGTGLLPWQKDAFNTVKGARFSFVVAFMGSGKSFVQLTLGADEIIKSGYIQKQLVIVPQSHIHRGFVEADVYLKGKAIKWEILEDHRFLSDSQTQVSVKLKKWLLTPGDKLFSEAEGSPKHLKGITAVATHMSLGYVWKRLTPAEKMKALHNLTLRVDEAHHLNNILDVEEELTAEERSEAESESTILGTICSYIMASRDQTTHLSLTTATPFRGDQDDILKKGAKAKFKQYYLPFFDHWKTLGIKNFYLKFLMYKSNPIKMCLEKIAAEPNEHHMVIVPTSVGSWRKSGYDYTVLVKKLEKMFPGQVLDLVPIKTRRASKERLFAEPRTPEDGPSNIRVIVTCMVGREGTDWCPCSRLHNLSVESTLTLAVQTLGRPFRRFAGKTEVLCLNYVPDFSAPSKQETIRDVLANRTNSLLLCMQFDEGFHPVLLPAVATRFDKRTGAHGGETRTLESALKDQGVSYTDFTRDLITEIERLPVEKRTDSNQIASTIEGVMDGNDVTEFREQIAMAAQTYLGRTWLVGHKFEADQMRLKGIDVSFLMGSFDKLMQSVDKKDRSLCFVGQYAERDLRTLRSVFDEGFEEWKANFLKNADLYESWKTKDAEA